MTISEPPELVGFDAAAALEAGRDVAGDHLLTCVEFTAEDLHPLYVSDQVLAMYSGREHMLEHFRDIHGHLHVDRGERELVERELAAAGEARYFVTEMEYASNLRLLAADGFAGLWVTLADGAPLTETAEAMRAAGFDDEAGPSPYE